MKKLVLLSFLISSYAFAGMQPMSVGSLPLTKTVITNAADPVSFDGDSRYNSLMNYFAAGMQPSMAEVEGWWSGRCYSKTAMNEPKGQLLVATNVTKLPPDSTGNGPLFPAPAPTTTFNMAVISHYNGQGAEAERYDNLSVSDRADVENFVKSDADFQNMAARIENGSLASDNTTGNLRFVLRRYSNYFVVENVIIGNDGVNVAGDVFAACYFFKKVN